MKKKESHTGFRNGDLFCFNCGGSYKIPYPQPFSMASAMMVQFDKDHKGCEKNWVEPIANANDKSERENADWWLTNGSRGISSETMFFYLDYRHVPVGKYYGHPSDPDDFSRCYKLLEAVPQWKSKLDLMRPVSEVWNKLIDNWDTLTAKYEQNIKEDWKNYKKVGMYDLMKKIGC